MTCRTYNTRHFNKAEKGHEFFDRYFEPNVVFVRPVHKGQTKPEVPEKSGPVGLDYLIQTLDGTWKAFTDLKTSPKMLAEIAKHSSGIMWEH